MQIINPSTEEIIRELKEDTKGTILSKFQALRAAQPLWDKAPLSDRVNVLRIYSNLLEKNIERLSAILTSEVGKPLQQSRNEVNGARTRIKWLAENTEKYLSDEWMIREPGLAEKISY